MPELPEVEVVRRGLAEHVAGRVVGAVTITHPRSVRRHLAGSADLAARMTGRRVRAAQRRGKYLWLTFDEPGAADETALDAALVVHLGMSGQMLVQPADAPVEKHAHIRAALDDGSELRFVDQRTFGGWALAPLAEVDGSLVPEPVAHIARDPLDPRFDAESVVAAIRAKNSEIKRVLLDQTVVSGIGNIYADESLWRAGINGNRLASGLTRPAVRRLLAEVRAVMLEALAAGGTSFDALYVNVNGQSGYFERALAVYDRQDEPCRRCGAPIVREKFMNRSSYSCPRCQPRPRRR
ncbi:bifunctional DNA-formamidopyrimidine glycosylase/DNA-(apurinic or apyrimidinic site) lyase [Nocardia farcinica]|uniref:bifunctional DNA-formamidopyrimidine glycosylase/DNA-(apurinic or apyrimidinic site) lyase n=1 Tax=Nocardia farcinica TaxID=37329 RepID=UPI0018949B93|nr:bifunctional DNA-formamidopyrimidine glycosylase/DNA-(apurinic or apyrimidinic site) lyase [Nocardia farcinica]MBF6261752.1 bifunctional DNA-formamidopyrimidine glycosylase/DNA-(apurinic or apyrimidinic site) lyase [Nocardia farcinica]MBF6280291.1 bifunctional DNA-formamidopyrimidine glycosylase/DNA-(apurinic or apyrimidinic site) lyase [Nocardia farcinica]MBF6305253.1 bifunctional DNA-formamidopyrimidine glycosylase/DNA-(apurinic or apyrimidinic site) lyase [Nocardia farcinica]MBF6391678.1 